MEPDAASTGKQAQGARSREEILDAAERLMGARGYAATSISALAAESGLPTSSIYWHFGSKSGVLGAVMERGSQRFFSGTAPESRPEHADPRDRLRFLLSTTTVVIREHPRFLRLFVALLLGAEGEHAQQQAVTRVRAEGRRLVAGGMGWVYRPWGEPVAEEIATRLSDMLLVLFDGLFLTAEVSAEVPAGLLEQAVRAVHSAAAAIRDERRPA